MKAEEVTRAAALVRFIQYHESTRSAKELEGKFWYTEAQQELSDILDTTDGIDLIRRGLEEENLARSYLGDPEAWNNDGVTLAVMALDLFRHAQDFKTLGEYLMK